MMSANSRREAAMIYLVIARCGEYSDKSTWVVQVLTDEAEAVEEAARLNATIPITLQLAKDYWERWYIRGQEISGGRAFDENTIQQLLAELGYRHPEDIDDYTVVAVPVGERGKWDLP